MSVSRETVLLFLVGCAFRVVLGQPPVRSQVETALDSWSDRTEARDAVLKVTGDPVPVLGSIAGSKDSPDTRRFHAIALLATFKTEDSEHALNRLAEDLNPKCRCAALRSLAELETRRALPVLIRKLDDQAVCMENASTDPPEGRAVYVSDEAVRLLEQITGQSFAPGWVKGHRTTQPWRKWWAEQRVSGEGQK